MSTVGRRSTLPDSWHVKLPAFEGPLDLLLHLIRVNEVEITDIPVALVCDQFHEYLSLMEEMNLDVAADYIYEAALLIHIKSSLLLPRPKTENGEPAEDPRQQLVERLLEYRRLKEAAQTLAEVDSVRSGIWTRPKQSLAYVKPEEEEIELGDLSLFDLLSTLREVRNRYDREHPEPPHLSREVFSVRDQFEHYLEKLGSGGPVDLLDDLRSRRSRGEIVAAFLSVLELARLHLVRLYQTDGGELLMQRTERELSADELEGIRA